MLLLSEGHMSDHTGAKLLYPHLPAAETLIADKGLGFLVNPTWAHFAGGILLQKILCRLTRFHVEFRF